MRVCVSDARKLALASLVAPPEGGDRLDLPARYFLLIFVMEFYCDDENEFLLFQYLSKSHVKKEILKNIVIPHLISKGFESVDDLRDLEPKYLDHDGELHN